MTARLKMSTAAPWFIGMVGLLTSFSASASSYAVSTDSINNFSITGIPMSREPAFVQAFGYVKKAAALANRDAGHLDARIADAIAKAADDELIGTCGFICRVNATMRRVATGSEMATTTTFAATTPAWRSTSPRTFSFT